MTQNRKDGIAQIKGAAIFGFAGSIVPTTISEYYRDRSIWRAIAIFWALLTAIVGYVFAGVLGILFGMLAGVIGIYLPVGREKIIERNRG